MEKKETKKQRNKENKNKNWGERGGDLHLLKIFLQVASVSKSLMSFTTKNAAVHSPLRFTDELLSCSS